MPARVTARLLCFGPLIWNAVETARLLIRAGADVNAANDFRMTPLSQACTNGSAAFVDLLLKAGANPNTPSLRASPRS